MTTVSEAMAIYEEAVCCGAEHEDALDAVYCMPGGPAVIESLMRCLSEEVIV